MIDIVISQELKKVCPEMMLGCIQAYVKVESSTDNLCEEIDDYCDSLKKEMSIEELASSPRIRDGREAYKKLGKAPGKYRLSSEALIRRVLQGKGVYRINNIVDINNLISLKSMFPVGSYDISNLHSPVSLAIGKKDERYKGIGKEILNIEYLPVLRDAVSSFGSPTSDSERAMIKDDAREVLMCVYSFSGSADLEEYLKYAEELLEGYAGGKDIEVKIIR